MEITSCFCFCIQDAKGKHWKAFDKFKFKEQSTSNSLKVVFLSLTNSRFSNIDKRFFVVLGTDFLWKKSAREEQLEWMIWQSQPQMERHMQHYHQSKYKYFPFG